MVRELKTGGIHEKRGERILVEKQEAPDGWYVLKAEGMTVTDVAERVARVMGIPTKKVRLPGKFKQQVVVRSLLCYWSVRELGVRMTSLGKR